MNPKIQVESDPFGSRLVRPVFNDERLVQYQLHLLTRHRPAQILPCSLRMRLGCHQLCLDTTGCSSLKKVLRAESLNPDQAFKILHSIVSILVDASDILLPVGQFILDVEGVYFKNGIIASDALMLGFLPLEPTDAESQTGVFLAELAKKLDLAPGFATEIICRFDKGGLPDLQKFLMKSENGPTEVEKSLSKKQSNIRILLIENVDSIRVFLVRHFKLFLSWLNGEPAKEQSTFDSQTVLLAANPEDYRMALLSEGLPGTPEENEGMRAFILTDEFLIGRELKSCDLFLQSPGIGRQHARITRRAGSFYITDLGSRNGTRVDGQRLLKNTDVLLPEQSVIQFADQSFHFQVD